MAFGKKRLSPREAALAAADDEAAQRTRDQDRRERELKASRRREREFISRESRKQLGYATQPDDWEFYLVEGNAQGDGFDAGYETFLDGVRVTAWVAGHGSRDSMKRYVVFEPRDRAEFGRALQSLRT